ncbi:hypothetical protein HMPREF3098_02030 [Corynebacterium sp. HMSC28B08]|nr:hypothetical protein HMPREF3098_02030 [Corynebacterium sp. HMSC28B08]
MVWDALILFPEVESQPDTVGVDIVVKKSIANQVNTVKELRDKAHQTQEAATAALAQTVRVLSAQSLPYRDIGQLHGISFQRAQKISKA